MSENDTDNVARDIISDSGALLELSNVLNASTDLEFILSNILLTSMGKLLVTRGVVLVRQKDETFHIRSIKGIRRHCFASSFHIPVQWDSVVDIETLLADSNEELRAFARCSADCELHIVIPMQLEHRMVGVMLLGRKINGASFSSSEIRFLESVASIAAGAVRNALIIEELRQVNRRLDKKIQEMNSLFELSREMNATLDTSVILRILGYTLMGQLRVLRYIVFTWNGTSLRASAVKMPDFRERSDMQEQLMQFDETIQFSSRRSPENEAERWLEELGIRTIVPMLSQTQLRGVLCLGERVGGDEFDRSELEYLSAFARMSISELENARLFSEMVIKERMEKELSLAKSIQQGLLPDSIPEVPGYDISGINVSSQQVGGDYFDVIPLSNHEYVLVIGDVSGKGIPAALLMANLQAALRVIAPLRLPLPEATARINALIHANTGIDKFITMFWGMLDIREHTLEYVNAGHNPPYLLRSDGTMEKLTEGGLILGIMPDAPPYQSACISLHTGDVLVSYTDGVNEAMSGEQQEFGDERFLVLLQRERSSPATALIQHVRDEILEFTHGAAQSDDITMLIVKRNQ